MQPGSGAVIGDLDLGAKAGELIEGPGLGRAGEGSGQHPDAAATFDEPPQMRDHLSDTAEANERHQNLDIVGRSDLAFKLMQQRRLTGRVGEQRRETKRRLRAANRHHLASGGGTRHLNQRQGRGRGDDVITGSIDLRQVLGDGFQHGVGQLGASFDTLVRRQTLDRSTSDFTD